MNKYKTLLLLTMLLQSCETTNNNTGEKAALLVVAIPALVIGSPFLLADKMKKEKKGNSEENLVGIKAGTSMENVRKTLGEPKATYICGDAQYILEYSPDIITKGSPFMFFDSDHKFINIVNGSSNCNLLPSNNP